MKNNQASNFNLKKHKNIFLKFAIMKFYSQLQDTKKYGNVTMNAQVEDIYLKEKNQMFQLGIWGSLAILLVLVTLDRLKK